MRSVSRLTILILTLILAACAAAPQEPVKKAEIITPLPGLPVDPPDNLLKQAVKDFLAAEGAPAFSLYTFSRVDLDDDGRREALVMFNNPYGYWCDIHGCTMLVFRAEDTGFKLTGSVQPVREPLYISNIKTNGWKNMIIHVSGRWERTKDVALQFDGAKYPQDPSYLPEYLRYASNDEMEIFYR